MVLARVLSGDGHSGAHVISSKLLFARSVFDSRVDSGGRVQVPVGLTMTRKTIIHLCIQEK